MAGGSGPGVGQQQPGLSIKRAPPLLAFLPLSPSSHRSHNLLTVPPIPPFWAEAYLHLTLVPIFLSCLYTVLSQKPELIGDQPALSRDMGHQLEDRHRRKKPKDPPSSGNKPVSSRQRQNGQKGQNGKNTGSPALDVRTLAAAIENITGLAHVSHDVCVNNCTASVPTALVCQKMWTN